MCAHLCWCAHVHLCEQSHLHLCVGVSATYVPVHASACVSVSLSLPLTRKPYDTDDAHLHQLLAAAEDLTIEHSAIELLEEAKHQEEAVEW